MADVVGIDQVARGIDQRHMQRDEIAAAQHLVDAVRLLHLRRQAPGRIDGDLRVVAEHVHAQLDRGVGHQAADLAQADDAQRVAGQLEAGEVLLAVLHRLVHVGHRRHRAPATKRSAGTQVARRHQHAGEHQFLDRVGVRARRVEHRHAARAHRRYRDVVGAGAGAADGLDAGGMSMACMSCERTSTASGRRRPCRLCSARAEAACSPSAEIWLSVRTAALEFSHACGLELVPCSSTSACTPSIGMAL